MAKSQQTLEAEAIVAGLVVMKKIFEQPQSEFELKTKLNFMARGHTVELYEKVLEDLKNCKL